VKTWKCFLLYNKYAQNQEATGVIFDHPGLGCLVLMSCDSVMYRDEKRVP
jgi:hypothetical protein